MPSELDQPWESAASSVPMVHGSACVIENADYNDETSVYCGHQSSKIYCKV